MNPRLSKTSKTFGLRKEERSFTGKILELGVESTFTKMLMARENWMWGCSQVHGNDIYKGQTRKPKGIEHHRGRFDIQNNCTSDL
jgi:hypothetical protein